MILHGVVDANKITQSELAILKYTDKYQIPCCFHFYHEPFIGGLSFIMYVNNKAISVPKRFQIDPALQAVLIGLAIATQIDSGLLKQLNDIRLITDTGLYQYDPVLVANTDRDSTNIFTITEYGKVNLSAVKELSYFIHGSQATAIQKKSDLFVYGFPVFHNDSTEAILDKINNATKQTKDQGINEINIKIIGDPQYLDRMYELISYCLKELSIIEIFVARITFNYINNHDVFEIYFIGE